MRARRPLPDVLNGPVSAAAQRAAVERDVLLKGAPGDRSRLGIVHTPPAVALAAMARVDTRLCEFGLAGGLADERVALLDLSVGTGAWLAAALDIAGARSGAPGFVVGYELQRAVAATADAVLSQAAASAGWPLALRVANTLGIEDPWPADGPDVRVVVGNPPWASRTANADVMPTASWLEDFRREPGGGPLRERRSGVLSDDYVRFFRWAAEQARHSVGPAVLCLATNSSYLDGPVHRGMRAQLAGWFDQIEIVDLGGNALLSRTGEQDGNVFGVRPGAALGLLSRPEHPSSRSSVGARQVVYRRLRGSARSKLQALSAAGQGGATSVPLQQPGQRWSPLPGGGATRWPGSALSLADAFVFHREGVQTNRDAFATDTSRARLLARMRAFSEGGAGPAASGHFDPSLARRRLQAALADDPAGESWIRKLAYRPFEQRWFAALAPVSHRPRPELLRAVPPSRPGAAGGADLCLLSARKDRGERAWTLFGVSEGVADACYLSTRSSCRTRVFPPRGPSGADNLSPLVREAWATSALPAPSAEGFIRYALALFASGSYRDAHAGLLKSDYPQVLLPADADAFGKAVSVGVQLQLALTGPIAPAVPLATPAEVPAGPEVALLGVGHHSVEALSDGGAGPLRERLAAWTAACDTADQLYRAGAYMSAG